MNPDIWILAEQKNGKLQRVTFELITRALELAKKCGTGVSAMLFGNEIDDNQLNQVISCGVDKLFFVQHTILEQFLLEPYSVCMTEIINKYKPEIILAGATTTGRTLMPYVAIKADTGLTADCTRLDIEPETCNLIQTRPAIGGNIMAAIKTPSHRPQMATVRPRSTSPAENINNKGEIIKLQPQSQISSRLKITEHIPASDLLSLAEADIVVAVGRGIKKKDNLPMIYQFAESLNAAVGATRDVIDRGWLSYSHQIGLSGQTVSPKIYIGIGLSGTIQHIAGMQTSEKIIAVNNDPDAQIFKIADYGIAADLFEVVPMLTEQIKKGKIL